MSEGRELTVLDWIGVAVAGTVGIALAWLAFAAGRFAGMYRDFGAPERLPLLTRVATSPWPAALLALLVLTATAAGAVTPTLALPTRRAIVVAAFLLGLAAVATLLTGLYLPIFTLAGSIRSD